MILIAFGQYIRVVVLGVTRAARHCHELGQQAPYAKSAHVEFPGRHPNLSAKYWRRIVMDAQNGTIGVLLASWGMGVANWDSITPCHRLEANVLIWVYCPYLSSHFVMESLQVKYFGKSWHHNEWIFVHVTRPWLVYYLIANHIWIVFQDLCHFFPIGLKMIKDSKLIGIEGLKRSVDGISSIKNRPFIENAVIVIGDSAIRTILDRIVANWFGKVMENLMRSHPWRGTIAASPFSEQVLMVLHKGINSPFAQFVDQIGSDFDVSLIDHSSSRVGARPVDHHPGRIESHLLDRLIVLFRHLIFVGKLAFHYVDPMEDYFPALGVIEFTVLQGEVTRKRSIHQHQGQQQLVHSAICYQIYNYQTKKL